MVPFKVEFKRRDTKLIVVKFSLEKVSFQPLYTQYIMKGCKYRPTNILKKSRSSQC